MTAKPAILFDLDGTLADSLPDLAASTNYVREHYALPPVDHDTIRSYIGDGARTLLRRALAERQFTEQELERAFTRYGEHHQAQCTVHTTLFPGVREHLTDLRRQGHAIAIVTNKPERFAVPVARHLGLDAFTEVIIGGDTLATKKPDAAMLRLALERMACQAATATMVGDGLQDLQAGQALGLRTIACLFGYGDERALRRQGADVFWRKFAQPV